MRSGSTLVIIPTFEEVENIETVLRRVRSAAPTVDVLVVDDNSSDGTAMCAEAVARRARTDPRPPTQAQRGPRIRVPNGVRVRDRAWLRRVGGDGCRSLARSSGAPRADRRSRARRRPRDRFALCARWLDADMAVPATCAVATRERLRVRCPRTRRVGPDVGVPLVPCRRVAKHVVRDDARGGLCVPDRDGVPSRSGRRSHRAGPDRVQ